MDGRQVEAFLLFPEHVPDLHVRPENDTSEICMWFNDCSFMG